MSISLTLTYRPEYLGLSDKEFSKAQVEYEGIVSEIIAEHEARKAELEPIEPPTDEEYNEALDDFLIEVMVSDYNYWVANRDNITYQELCAYHKKYTWARKD